MPQPGKAVVIGVNDYGSIAPSLQAPTYEMSEWASLLTNVYRFQALNVRTYTPLRNVIPTRTNVIQDLIWLFQGAHTGDELVLIFGGHGMTVYRGGSVGEQGLILTPEAGVTRPEDAALTDSDLVQIISNSNVTAGVRTTFVIDCCFSGNLAVHPPGGMPLFVESTSQRLVPETFRIQESELLIRQFGLLAGLPVDLAFARPIIVTASSATENAFQLPVNRRPRLLFSSRAQPELRLNHQDTYDRLISNIKPLQRGVPQTPGLNGDLGRRGNQFLQ